jgi:lysophospholipid acyltransferase (LPLAT)-like uncharacterized protein
VINSWDRFLLPKPFTRIVVSWGLWTMVSEETTNEELESLRDQLDVALERARERANTHLAKRNA